MGAYNLILRVHKLKEKISNIEDTAGKILVKNIKKQAEMDFGHGQSGYPYEFKNDFQKDSTVFYRDNEKSVHVHHPAAFVLEYGIGSQTIKPVKAKALRFIGKDGEVVYADEVTISPKKPVGYVAKAINQTKQELKNKFSLDSIAVKE